MAPVRRHDFSGPDDLRAMQQLASRLWSPTSRFHPGQLAWSRYYRPVDPSALDEGEAIAVWTDGDEVLGFGWAEAPDWLELQVDPSRPDVAADVVDWFEEVSDAETQSALVMEGDVAERALAAAGFAPQPDEPYFTHHTVDLADLPPAPTVPGYRFRHVEPHEARSRAAVHAASWSEFGPVEGRRAGLRAAHGGMALPPRPRLGRRRRRRHHGGLGARVARSGLRSRSRRAGGCVPEHRGRGLAGAVTSAALRRLAEVGGSVAQVSPRGDDGYPGPQRLYRSLGFRPRARTVTWTRSLD